MSNFKFGQRTPLNYDGAQSTNKLLSECVLETWLSMLSEPYASKTKAVSFKYRILLVKVNDFDLYERLEEYEKPKLLRILQEKVPVADIKDIAFVYLPKMMDNIQKEIKLNPQLVINTWPSMFAKVFLPEVLASFTRAISFIDGSLLVRVKSSLLYNTLDQQFKPILLRAMQEKLPAANIKNIVFKFG